MTFDFDTLLDRAGSGSKKWGRYPDEVLPMWVADMDFAVAPVIQQALQQRIAHPAFGYCLATDALRHTLVDYLWHNYAWRIEPQDLVFLPGIEPGVSMALRSLIELGAGVVVQTPNYSPLRNAASHWQLPSIELPFQADLQGHCYTDIPALHEVLASAGALLLSNPHNPLGKSFSASELTDIGHACVEHNALIISDEIHADLQFDGLRHVPIASLDPQFAHRTVTLMSASKAYNIAGLKTAFAVIQNPQLRERFDNARAGMVDSVNALGLEATRAAYADARPWLIELLAYLQGNRDYLLEAVRSRLPGITLHTPQSTYLAWLDCSALGLEDPQRFFLEEAKVALSAGTEFGAACQQFVRLNFGCPRSTLEEGLARMERSLRGTTKP